MRAFIDAENKVRVNQHNGDVTHILCGCQQMEIIGREWLDGEEVLCVSPNIDLCQQCKVITENEQIVAQPLGVLESALFAKQFNYDGELGNIIDGERVTFRLWSPFASKVTLNIYDKGNGKSDSDKKDIPMQKSGGVWEVTLGGVNGKYYTYKVNGVETADPYAHTAGINGVRSMVLDFNDYMLSPFGWDSEHTEYATMHAPKKNTDCVIWETHVRDFSHAVKSSKHRCKYLAFGEDMENDSGEPVGLNYLIDLGITHVHILPIGEYATVDQRRSGCSSKNAFNWGYDPLSHNVPSGVYSEDPYDGSARVREVREMVAMLHMAGIGVVLDVVYNHTYDMNCPLGVSCGEYYYRRDRQGMLTNGSGCGNELSSERYMTSKYIIDSLKFWAKEYHVDGFRFDLMGLMDIDTVQRAREELLRINPNIIMYGEPWQGGWSPLAGHLSANKYNTLTKLDGVGIFSDTIRDGIKGSTFREEEGGYVNGRAWENINQIKFSIMGGTSKNFGMDWHSEDAGSVINYVSAHDNHTLWDKLLLSAGGASKEERNVLNKMIAGIYLTCQGVPFMQAGEELRRSKPMGGGMYDHNSYKSPDSINSIKWDRLVEGSLCSELRDYYKGLISLRRGNELLRLSSPEEIENAINFIDIPDNYGVITYTLSSATEQLYIVYNPMGAFTLELPSGMWGEIANGERAGVNILARRTGQVEICSKCVYVFKKMMA